MPEKPGGGRIWPGLAAGTVIALAAVVACSKVWNYDVFWHLAGGRWMLQHHRVLGHDPFGLPEAPDGRPAVWVNIHWGFQLIVAAVHSVGGFGGLVVMKMAVFAATLAVFALWLRRQIAPAWLIVVGIWLILGTEGRVRVRPEIFTFLLLVGTLVLVESVRRGRSPNRLWWLVPINILWVNMHGLFVVGLAAAWAAVAGAAIDRAMGRDTAGPLATRRALLPMAAATAACFVSPWPIKAGLHPLLLWTRLAGHRLLYTYGVEELRPTWALNPLGSAPLLVALLLALATLAVLLLRVRSVPAGHALWFLTFFAVALPASRNLPLFVIPAALLLAIHGGALLHRLPSGPALKILRPAAAAAMLLLAAGIAAAYATEAVYRWQSRPESQFGLGRVQNIQPVAMAQWLQGYPADGDVLSVDFGNGGVFILYTPGRRVWMDGRLELHSPQRFKQQRETYRNLRSARRAGDPSRTPLPPSVRFLVVRAADTEHIEALAGQPQRFTPLYADPAGACFARIPLEGETVTVSDKRPLPPGNLADLDRPLALDVAPLLDVPTRRRWYRQNVLPAHWRMGAVLYSLGLDRLAIRYLTVADRLKLTHPGPVLRILAQSHQRLSEAEPIRPETDLPADINLARGLALHQRIDLRKLTDEEALAVAMARLRGLVNGNLIDAAYDGLPALLQIPAPKRSLTDDVQAMRQVVRVRYGLAQARSAAYNLAALQPADRALRLANIGLIDSAINTLRSAASPPRPARMLLGDLYLRKGLTAQARQAYSAAGGDDWDIRMRFGLCDWADGNLRAAADRLRSAADAKPAQPAAAAPAAPAAYLALLYEQLGHYPAAAEVLRTYQPAAAATPNSDVRAL
ncbi:MAG: hypothetical protein AMJ81_07960, partial [Phycisphaerae bacterium SM23_33]